MKEVRWIGEKVILSIESVLVEKCALQILALVCLYCNCNHALKMPANVYVVLLRYVLLPLMYLGGRYHPR